MFSALLLSFKKNRLLSLRLRICVQISNNWSNKYNDFNQYLSAIKKIYENSTSLHKEIQKYLFKHILRNIRKLSLRGLILHIPNLTISVNWGNRDKYALSFITSNLCNVCVYVDGQYLEFWGKFICILNSLSSLHIMHILIVIKWKTTDDNQLGIQ